MSARTRFARLPRLLLLSLALAAPAACAPVAPSDDSYVFGLVTLAPMVHVPISGSATYAQLIRQLRSQGYGDITLTPLSPNLFDPRPELTHPDLDFVSPADAGAGETQVHPGWNGTAARDGRSVDVYVDRAPR